MIAILISYLSIECDSARLAFRANASRPRWVIFTTWFNSTTYIFQEYEFSSESGKRKIKTKLMLDLESSKS